MLFVAQMDIFLTLNMIELNSKQWLLICVNKLSSSFLLISYGNPVTLIWDGTRRKSAIKLNERIYFLNMMRVSINTSYLRTDNFDYLSTVLRSG